MNDEGNNNAALLISILILGGVAVFSLLKAFQLLSKYF